VDDDQVTDDAESGLTSPVARMKAYVWGFALLPAAQMR
jgi:hypothetical protein